MIEDIVYSDTQYFEIKMEDEDNSPDIIIFGLDNSTDINPSGGGESISIF